VIKKWREAGPQPLNSDACGVDGQKLENPPQFTSGVWLFLDRQNITHFFPPNFSPPYTTPGKRKIILDVLREEWDEETLSWIPVGSKLKKKNVKEIATREETTNNDMDDSDPFGELSKLVSDTIKHVTCGATE